MAVKEVVLISAPGQPHFVGDGFRVHNFIPGTPQLTMQRMDPFILLDYNSVYNFGPTEIPRGVGVHPHKGFETVTIAYKGRVEHGDSSGGGGIIGEGDVQWMTAAGGVLHKEFHETEWAKKGGDFQMVQLWVNLPARHKQDKAKYQAITNSSMPHAELGEGSYVEVIAGEYMGKKGPASTYTPLYMFNAKFNAGTEGQFDFKEGYTTLVLMIKGNAIINGNAELKQDHLAVFGDEGTHFTLKATDDCVALVLSGEPLREPIAAHGPFVMNTRKELMEAFEDFQSGRFGHLA